jgi:hypothetical protein
MLSLGVRTKKKAFIAKPFLNNDFITSNFRNVANYPNFAVSDDGFNGKRTWDVALKMKRYVQKIISVK